jgi:putative endonuclease
MEHNEGFSRYTSIKGPWTLVYQKMFETKREALIEEKRIKKLNRESVLRLIANQNMED